MVSTRTSRSKVSPEDIQKKKIQDDDDFQDAEPKPISSSSEDSSSNDDEDESMSSASVKEDKLSSLETKVQQKPTSRLFAPYRSLGVISSGRPYFLSNHGSSSKSSFCTLPIGNQFQIMQCDKLQPVMISRACSSGNIQHLISDASLGITVAAHSNFKTTLYARTKPLETVTVASSRQWSVVDMLHLGKTQMKMDGEKEGKTENAVIVAVVLAKDVHDDDVDPDVQVLGNENDDSSSDDDSSDDSSSDDDDDDDDEYAPDCVGQVVIMIASRTSLMVHNRIPLPSKFHPRVALHPSTYLNKIIIGSSSSHKEPLILVNIKTGKIIHSFSCLPTNNSKPYYVTALEQSPAVDTVAVGTSHGMVHLINLRHDMKLFSLSHKGNQKSKPRITSLSFRTDGSAMRYGIAPLAVGRSDGTISIWDLTPASEDDSDDEGNYGTAGKGRRLLCDMPQVHPGGVAKLTYLPQEPLLLSTGTASNSIQMHVFDNPDHTGRLLRQRSGHTSPPTCISYKYPSNGLLLQSAMDGTDAATCQIYSGGGKDRTLRVFSSARSVLDKELSQGKGLEKKAKQLGLASKDELLLPPIIGMATAEARKRDWGDLVTVHRNSAFAYVWNSQTGSQSGPILRQNSWNVSAMAQKKPPEKVHATCVTISSCGNFCLVGTKGGTIYKYNIQSGIPRGSYPRNDENGDDENALSKQRLVGNVTRTIKKLEKQAAVSNRTSDMDKVEQDVAQDARIQEIRKKKLLLASHTGAAVKGLAVDSLNKTLMSVGSDGKLILWSFVNHVPHKKSPYQLPSPATKLCRVSDSDLAAIAMEDYTVVLFDCSALSTVRRFGAGKGSGAAHAGPITDLGFSPDGRSLFTSSLDGTIRVWDIPTNTCIDWLKFQTPPTALSLSPTGEFLATTHKGKLGISLWSDRSFYQTVHVDGANPPTVPAPIAEDGYESDDEQKQTGVAQVSKASELDKKEDENESKVVSPFEDGLITLSGLPPAHWKNLFHLELVKERNKPKEPPKKPPTAPFFLQFRSGESMSNDLPVEEKTEKNEKQDASAADEEEWDAAWSDEDDNDDSKAALRSDDTGKKRSKDLVDQESDDSGALVPVEKGLLVTQPKRKKIVHHRSHLAALLAECEHKTGSPRFQAVTDHVASLGPSGIDVALSTLCNGMHDLEEGLPLLRLTSLWLLEACQSRERYEAINAYLHRFLHIHSNVIAGIDDSTKKDTASPPSPELLEEEKNEQNQQHEQRLELLETIEKLSEVQRAASDTLRSKMQNSLCLLRHFSRMV